jgi:hypothetical protein
MVHIRRSQMVPTQSDGYTAASNVGPYGTLLCPICVDLSRMSLLVHLWGHYGAMPLLSPLSDLWYFVVLCADCGDLYGYVEV